MDGSGPGTLPDLICLSHLRWDFVLQRPQHLMTRFARERRVFFVEEPAWGPGPSRLWVRRKPEGVWVVVPYIGVPGLTEVQPDPPPGYVVDPEAHIDFQRRMLDQLVAEQGLQDAVLWYYTPMALPFSRHLRARAVVYDCMDELSAFSGASPELLRREAELLRRADVVFTGGHSLYEAKKDRHPQVHAFPSSVDMAHFAQGRQRQAEPEDQASIAHPRLGYFGVIDERMDLELLAAVARARPDWHLVMVGPVVKIDPATLPRLPNLHYLGGKKYAELPAYLAGWDVALIPFLRNAATRFLSPTKTPEYLSAGKPVVSTSIRDVVHPYGVQDMVGIADTPEDFVREVEARLSPAPREWLERVDAHLKTMSWDLTWGRMKALMDRAAQARAPLHGVMTEEASAP